jgi:zinc transporter
VLTIVTVLALPINLVAALFGMNVGGIPLAQHRYGFFLVVGPLLVLTAFLACWGVGQTALLGSFSEVMSNPASVDN